MTTAGTSINAAIDRLLGGGMAIVVAGPAGHRIGHLVQCARFATPDAINFMASHGRGLVGLALEPGDAERLSLRRMKSRGQSPFLHDALVSIEARHGVSTGISAADRARTIQVAIDPESGPDDIVTPGHVFPYMVHPGGTLVRPAAAEAAVDLCRLAGLAPSAVTCAILDESGNAADMATLQAFGQRRGLPIVTIRDLVADRCRTDRLIDPTVCTAVDVENAGMFEARAYRSRCDGREVLALVRHPLPEAEPVLVRLHEALPLYDLIAVKGRRARLLQQCLAEIAGHGSGVLLLIDNWRPGLLAQSLPRRSHKPALRFPDYSLAAQILADLGIAQAELLTTLPEQREGLEEFGLEVTGIRPFVTEAGAEADAVAA